MAFSYILGVLWLLLFLPPPFPVLPSLVKVIKMNSDLTFLMTTLRLVPEEMENEKGYLL